MNQIAILIQQALINREEERAHPVKAVPEKPRRLTDNELYAQAIDAGLEADEAYMRVLDRWYSENGY